jgi:hypothetical protein
LLRYGMTDIDLSDLRQTLDAIAADSTLQDDTQHARRLVLITALLSEAFRRYECRATLMGGVVEGLGKSSTRLVLDPVFAALGFKKLPARHWAREDVFVEVPGSLLEDPVEETQVGPYRLRVVVKEAVIVGRIVEYDQTGNLPHARQAILLLQALGNRIDQAVLADLLRRERAAAAYEVLRAFADRPEVTVTDEALIEAREQLRKRPPELRHQAPMRPYRRNQLAGAGRPDDQDQPNRLQDVGPPRARGSLGERQ